MMMNNEMGRLCMAVEEAQSGTNPRQSDMREAIVRAVLREVQDIVRGQSGDSIHDAQAAHYTTIAINRILG